MHALLQETLAVPNSMGSLLRHSLVSLECSQQTLAAPISCTGIGVHSAASATLTIRPAPVGSGFVFLRTDVPIEIARVEARWDTVTDTAMCTKITNQHGISVSTVEHVLAALWGMGVTNAVLEIDGPEVPIMDGSSAPFVAMIQSIGLHRQKKMVPTLIIDRPIEIQGNNASAGFYPADEISYAMTFNANGRLANQSWSLTYRPDMDRFEDLLAEARTFGFYEDAQRLWAMGLAKGASLDNTIVIQEGSIMNEDGLRFSDEFVRHKMLDAIGDFALAGCRIIGEFRGHNSGHALNNQLLRKIFAEFS